MGGCRVVEAAGRGLAGLAGRLVTVGSPPQGIADGADGHAERIEADRAGVADLPAEARRAGTDATTATGGKTREVGALPHGTGAAPPRRRHEGATGRSMGHG